jgi:peptide/nickel transport system substrate-binding protein
MADVEQHPYVPTLVDQLRRNEVDRREFFRTAALLGVSASAAMGLAGLPLPARAQANKPRGGTLRIATTVYDLKSPATASTTAHPLVFAQVLEYLVKIGADNVARGQLLQGWQPSADLKTWTLRIRPGVKWHSGRAFTARDVDWNLRRLLSDATGSSVLGLMSGYMLNATDTGQVNERGRKIIRHDLWSPRAIEVVDDMTLRLNLKQPQLAVPEHLAHFPAVMMFPEENGVFGPGSVGTGPFKLTELQPGRRAVIEAVKGYWGDGPYLDKVEFIDVGGSETAIANALVSKQVDGAFQVLPDSFPVLRQQAHLQYYEAISADTVTTRMNVRHKPFDDARVRRAFRLAVDTAKVSDLTFGQFSAPAEHHHVAPIHPEYAKLPPMVRNVDQAKRLLSEAGYPNGVDVEIVIQQNPPHHMRHATALQAMWKDAGIRATIKVVPNPQYWDIWLTAPLGSTVWAHRSLGIMNLSLAYRTGVAWNESAYANPRFDKLLDEAEATPDPKARAVKMMELQRIMQDDGPVVQTYWRKLFTFYDKRVVGFAMHPEYQLECNELALMPA